MPLNPFPDPQTYKIIGAGMAAHAELGCGFLEKIYRCALSVEFERFGVPFAIEETLRINYKGRELPVNYQVDFVCFKTIMVEVKALNAITTKEEAHSSTT